VKEVRIEDTRLFQHIKEKLSARRFLSIDTVVDRFILNKLSKLLFPCFIAYL